MDLEFRTDAYDAVHVKMDGEKMRNVLGYMEAMERHVAQWKQERRCAVWVKVPVERVEILPILIAAGFTLHHARADYVMVTQWLLDPPSKLPDYAHTTVGVGCFVLNDRGEVLAVQERNGPLKGSGVWKFPGGLVDFGEDISTAACRECEEETSVCAEFKGILGFRHNVHGIHGTSDIFAVCILRPLTEAIIPQESEIEAVRWMPVSMIDSHGVYHATHF